MNNISNKKDIAIKQGNIFIILAETAGNTQEISSS
jgi:hypothetical protein